MKHALRKISANWKSALTVALVSVPLSLSLAIASGASPIMGIITAIWAGAVAAFFGGSRFNVVGPAGALSGILASFAMHYGPALLPMLAIFSGLLVFVFYFLQWEKYLVFIPSSVMHGFTFGVGLTIALGQLNFALGLQDLPKKETLLSSVLQTLEHLGQVHLPTFLLFLFGLAFLFGLLYLLPKVPGAVLLAAIGILLGYLSEQHFSPYSFQTLFSKYGSFHATLVQVPVLALPPLTLEFWKAAFTVAVVAVLETLLSAKIADGMTNSRFNQKKEMRGLALANIASGLAGGLPATGVLARTAMNIKSGASSAWSSGLNAFFVALIALLLFRYFQFLPLAVVASILVFAAIRMVEVEHFRKLYVFDQSSFWLAMLVASITFGVDPMVSILVGSSIALLEFVQHISRGASELTLHRDRQLLARIPHHRLHEYKEKIDVVVYRFAGELTYFNGNSHADRIKKIHADTVILSMRNLFYIDLDGLDMLENILLQQEKQGSSLLITGVGEFIGPLLQKTSWYAKKEKAGEVFSSTTEALNSLGFPLSNRK